MPRFDLRGEALERYDPQLTAPSDLSAFWERTLHATREHPLGAERTPAPSPLVAVQSFDVRFNGFGGEPMSGWLHLPAAALRDDRRLPAVVQFQGYNGGRGLVFENVFWAAAGYAHLVVDTRGQGSGWSVGATADDHGSGPAQPGFLTRGLDDPDRYFYRRAYADAVRAVEFARALPEVDPDAVVVCGASQGGGLALAVSALGDGVRAAMIDVPFLSDIRRASEIAPGEPYGELVRFLAAHRDLEPRAFETLAYFDGAILARLAEVPALFSVALMDETCPPSTVYAAYNAWAGPKEIAVYPYNGHEGGAVFHRERQAAWLAGVLGGR